MKKTISILLAAGMVLSQCNFAFAEDTMEKALLAVKENVTIPENLTKFETSTNNSQEKTVYSFNWSDEKHNSSISVQSDTAGHIVDYSQYKADWYKDDDRLKIDDNFNMTKLSDFASQELEKLVPQLFTSDTDLFVAVPFVGNLSLQNRCRYNFNFIRKYNNVEVKNNLASISVIKSGDTFEVCDAYINWDYDTEFVSAEKIIDSKAAENVFTEKYPVKLEYRKNYENKYFLEYNSKETQYIDAQNSEEIIEDQTYDVRPLPFGEAEEKKLDAAGASNSQLSPTESKELEEVEGLKTTAELLEKIYSMPEFGVIKTFVENSKISVSTYKVDEKYFTSISIADKDKKPETSSMVIRNPSIQAEFDAKSGELKSFYRFSHDVNKNANTEIKASQDKAHDFLKKYFADKVEQSDKNDSENDASYVRKVNDIPYSNNYIRASWNSEKNYIEAFNCEWDIDVSEIPAPNNILNISDANSAMYAKYPIKLMYILSGEKYRLVYSPSESNVSINAFNGKIVDYNGDEITERHTGEYSDTSDHWVKNIAKNLADYGIAFEENTLKPDSEITQSDFLKLVYSGVCGYNITADNDQLYRRMISQKVLSEEEINSTASITRENAITYLLRSMGIREVAEIKGIYICDFTDSDAISADKIGYCAIAKGYGIINGSDGALYPTNNITRAEALAMIYNYLTR